MMYSLKNLLSIDYVHGTSVIPTLTQLMFLLSTNTDVPPGPLLSFWSFPDGDGFLLPTDTVTEVHPFPSVQVTCGFRDEGS